MGHILKFITTIPGKENSHVITNYVSEETNLMVIDEYSPKLDIRERVRRSYVVEPLAVEREELIESICSRVIGEYSRLQFRDVPPIVALLLIRNLT